VSEAVAVVPPPTPLDPDNRRCASIQLLAGGGLGPPFWPIGIDETVPTFDLDHYIGTASAMSN
jgi:hypothetical protein